MAEREWTWRSEISGALGDIGIFFPITAALITLNGMSATGVLVAAGLFYIVSGWYFKLPMPVQPLKALSVIAIAAHSRPADIAAAGLILGSVFLALSWLGLLQRLAQIFPKALVRGIQLGLGFILVKSGILLMVTPTLIPAFPSLIQRFWGLLPYGLWIGMGVTVVLLLYGNHRSIPVTPLVILFGHLVGWFVGMIEGGIRFQWGPSAMGPASFQGVDLMVAFFLLAIPQFPLTFGNAMVGTSSAARAYFPEAGKRVTVRKLGFSYGIANIASVLLGGMPMCQGAGGLTAHVRFGARTARSTILFGALMITLGMTTGRSAPAILSLIPSPVLGSLLAIVGWEHSRLARDVGGKSSQMLVVFIMGITSLLTANLLYGLAAGIAVGLLLHFVPGNKKWHDIFGPFESL